MLLHIFTVVLVAAIVVPIIKHEINNKKNILTR